MALGNAFNLEYWDQYESRTAIVCGEQSCTYGELEHAIRAFSQKLRDMGVRKGDHVALWSFNSINWIVAYYATVRAGGIATLVNFSLLPQNIAPIAELTQSNFLLYGNTVARRDDPNAVQELLDLAHIQPQRSFDIDTASIDLVAAFKDTALSPDEDPAYSDDETSVIVFSSGTTNIPKAVQLSTRSIYQNIIGSHERSEPEDGELPVLSVLPLFHVFGIINLGHVLGVGSTIILPSVDGTHELVSIMKRYDINTIVAPVAIHLMLMADETFSPDLMPNLKLCVVGGSVTDPDQLAQIESSYKQARFINGYGMTELECISMCSPRESAELRFFSVGKAAVGTELRIVDTDGNTLPAGKTGEVVARGDGLTNGYMGLGPDEQPWDEEGWLHTGDLGRLSEDGHLYIMGRIKDIIIRGGENIAPSEVIAELLKLDNVAQAVVMGMPHPVFGESVEAFVMLYDQSKPFDAEEARAVLRSALPKFKIPSHILVRESFPKLSIGKPDMRALKEDMARSLGL